MDEPRIVDTRERGDRLGYRAIHVVWRLDRVSIEIQIRGALQQQRAQLVERLDQRFGWDLKHGVGPQPWLTWLYTVSEVLRRVDLGEGLEVTAIPTPPHPLR